LALCASPDQGHYNDSAKLRIGTILHGYLAQLFGRIAYTLPHPLTVQAHQSKHGFGTVIILFSLTHIFLEGDKMIVF
jgi:hypothetical protein